MKQAVLWMLFIFAIVALSGCASRAPTIAHVHIGHAMAGWYETPNKEGLFVLAEKRAGESLKYAQAAADGSRDLKRIKTNVAHAGMLCDSETMGNDPKEQFGVKQALTGAVSHITYAATSPDATTNVQAFADGFAANATGVMDRCDLIVALSSDIGGTQSVDEASLLAPEIEKLARANIQGEDLDGDGIVGSYADEYGLMQLRRDIESMIAREDPPYTTVNKWYLFNLIRLPDGSWMFRKRYTTDSDDPYGGGGGGGGGGY
jgi:hypothetical protein